MGLRMDDRKISMLAVRYLCQVAQAISFQVMSGATGAAKATEACMRCSDHAEHIAQYDVEGMTLEFRMQSIADSMEWLMVIMRQYEDVLASSKLNLPTDADLDALASAAVIQLA